MISDGGLCGPCADGSRGRDRNEEQPRDRQITGRLLGQDGKPMRLAHVHLAKQSVAADRDGRYRITVPTSGIARLRFSGVDHAEHVVPIAEGGEAELDVTLGTLDRPDPITEVELVVVAPSKDGGQVTSERQVDPRRLPPRWPSRTSQPARAMPPRAPMPNVRPLISTIATWRP